MPKPKRTDGLVQAGQIRLLPIVAAAVKPLTRAQEKLLAAAEAIQQDQADPADAAYMARQLVQCTLPHSDPGDVPIWSRRNGNITLSIVRTIRSPIWGQTPGKPVGYPYGTIPRLLLFWLITEAVRTRTRRIELGSSLSGFMRDIGLGPYNGTGKQSNAFRLRDQATRLFSACISFHQKGLLKPDADGEVSAEAGEQYMRFLDMRVASKAELWWRPRRPEQDTLWGSWIELGENFYEAITAAPVPVDLRVLRALKRSPLALDLYAWAAYRAYTVNRRRRQELVPWTCLRRQIGADYADMGNFRKKVRVVLRKLKVVYPAFIVTECPAGLLILPASQPAIGPRSR